MTEEKITELLAAKISGEWGSEPLNGGGTKVLRTTNFTNDGKLRLNSVVEREIDSKLIEKKKLIYGDTIIEKSGGSPTQPVGRVVFFDLRDGDYLCNNFTAILRPKKSVIPRFFFWALFYKHLNNVTLRYQNKTTGIINLKLERYLNEETIRFPDLKTQQKIASVLEQADAARQKRKEANRLTQQFLQSYLFELIGNNPIKDKKFPLKKLEEVCFEVADIDHNMPKAVEKGMPFISAKDLIDEGQISFEDIKFISVEDFKRLSRKIKPKRGDIIYSRIGAKLGKARIVKVDFDFLASYSCCTIRPNNDLVNTIYLNAYLDSEFNLRQAKLDTNGIGVPDLGMDKIRNFLIPYPPLPFQQKFASLVERVEKLREKQRESEREVENLFQALMQKHF